MAESANLSSGFSEQTITQCQGLMGQNVVLGTICFLVITMNSVLLAFSAKYRHGILTPDKMLITNFAVVDLIACLVSVPLHIAALNGRSDLGDNEGKEQSLCHEKKSMKYQCQKKSVRLDTDRDRLKTKYVLAITRGSGVRNKMLK